MTAVVGNVAAKLCTRCSTWRSPGEFAIDRGTKDGRSGWCKPCRRGWAREHRLQHPDKERASHLRKYGLTPGAYAALLAAQGGRCAICRTDQPRGNGARFHIDHDHTTGQVRGLLCSPCNSGLGHFQDDAGRLQAALAYLEAACRVEL